MTQNAKQFAEKLNQCLDEISAPEQIRERAAILAKMVNISKQQAWSLLEGHQLPNEALLELIIKEFDTEPDWFNK